MCAGGRNSENKQMLSCYAHCQNIVSATKGLGRRDLWRRNSVEFVQTYHQYYQKNPKWCDKKKPLCTKCSQKAKLEQNFSFQRSP